MKVKLSLPKLFFAVIIAGITFPAHSQNPYTLTAGARQAGLAYTCIATDGFWSSFHNQASLGFMRKLSLGINQDNRFGIAELSNKTFAIIYPSGYGSLGGVYSYYGYSEYNHHTAGLSYGMKLGPNIAAGVQVDLYSTRAATDYENTNELTFEAGLLYKPIPVLSLGLHIYNPLPNSIREYDMPTIMRLGTSYFFSQAFMTTVEFEYNNTGTNVYRAAMEYEPIENMFLRGGIMSNPLGYSFGLGYSGRVIQANLGFITHENLGLTPSLSIVIFIR
ncbi:MAG TPA: hypothetical protein VMW76_01770 [Bacteroidales bacterium]|nr:hypothetical protein [Bacteroidales bacterium]